LLNYGDAELGPDKVSWAVPAWFAALLLVCYAPVLLSLARQWETDQDMGHGFFVPILAGFIAWQKRGELLAQAPRPNWWGLGLVVLAGAQLYLATLGAEFFLARMAFVFSVIGIVLFLGGTGYVKTLAFPMMLLFFMIPIPAIIYNRITFPLQILASRAAEGTLLLLQIPVLREGNILELAEQRLSVVEACSGIRSLLSLSFLALVYGYFFESYKWIRVVLVLATIPIAILANASRVSLTGFLTEYQPELAEGFFHSASGWVIFMSALVMLIVFHQIVKRSYGLLHARG